MSNNKILKTAIFILALFVAGTSCKKLSRPALGDFPKDNDARFPLYPGGPLKFYAAFDGISTNPLMNAVDSVRANFPSDNPFVSVAGITGKAIQAASTKDKAIKYPSEGFGNLLFLSKH